MQILVNEKAVGKEQLKVTVDKLLGNVPLTFFGDPIGGSTGYAICLYDASDRRIATLRVNRPHDQCGPRACWKIASGTAYKYGDKLLASDGVLQLQLKAGMGDKGKVVAKGKRILAKGLTALPIGVAAALAGDSHATVQLLSSNAGCVTGTVTDVSDASSTYFKGSTP